MAHINKVMKSINNDDGSRCADIFLRPDHTYGFEEYRRDVEDGRGWFPIGRYSEKSFATESDALTAANNAVGWLK